MVEVGSVSNTVKDSPQKVQPANICFPEICLIDQDITIIDWARDKKCIRGQ